MKWNRWLSITVATAGLICLSLAGCSDDTIVYETAAGDGGTTQSELAAVFPVAEGHLTTYQVDNGSSSSKYVSYEVGPEVTFGSGSAYEWSVRSSTGERYTTHFVMTATALYFYENYNSDPEKILSLPLTVGRSWTRDDGQFDYTDTTGTDTDGTNDYKWDEEDETDNKPGDTTGGNGTLKTFPGNGASTYTIDGFEDLELPNGTVVRRTIRIINTSSTVTNYYWFGLGTGLVMYVLDADVSDRTTGGEVAHLVSNSMAPR